MNAGTLGNELKSRFSEIAGEAVENENNGKVGRYRLYDEREPRANTREHYTKDSNGNFKKDKNGKFVFDNALDDKGIKTFQDNMPWGVIGEVARDINYEKMSDEGKKEFGNFVYNNRVILQNKSLIPDAKGMREFYKKYNQKLNEQKKLEAQTHQKTSEPIPDPPKPPEPDWKAMYESEVSKNADLQARIAALKKQLLYEKSN